MKKTLEERVWEKIDKRGPTDCWEWRAGKTDGYGRLIIHGRLFLAHRVVYALQVGGVGFGAKDRNLGDDLVLHRCDNRACCNPKHLYVGTNHRNVLDREERSRGNRRTGAEHGRAKLTNEQVEHIRKATGTSGTKLAQMHGVHYSQIYRIRRGETWAHVA